MEMIGLALAIPAVLIANVGYGVLVTFVLIGAPSLASVLILATRPLARGWYLAVASCCAFGVFLVFFQVGVGDALFGVDGVGGPFSP
jgi:hypothetical protein